MVKKALDFSFINQDVQNQLAQSREILSVVQSIEATVANMSPGEARDKLEETAKRLLGIASTLTTNATSTSNSAALTIVSST